MKRSRLKNKANKSQLPGDLSKYKRQYKLNKKYTKEYFENLKTCYGLLLHISYSSGDLYIPKNN